MGWDVRDGRRYYSRSRKVGGRVVREYVGGGAAGQAAAAADALRRAEREASAEAARQRRAEHDAALAPLLRLCEATDLLARAALAAGGYHQHDGGQWRKRRVRREDEQTR
jgi:hypothetical protein